MTRVEVPMNSNDPADWLITGDWFMEQGKEKLGSACQQIGYAIERWNKVRNDSPTLFLSAPMWPWGTVYIAYSVLWGLSERRIGLLDRYGKWEHKNLDDVRKVAAGPTVVNKSIYSDEMIYRVSPASAPLLIKHYPRISWKFYKKLVEITQQKEFRA